MVEINLLRGNRKKIVERQEKVSVYLKYLMMVTVVIGVISGVLLTTNIYLVSGKNRIEQELKKQTIELKKYEQVAIDSLKIGLRLEAIEGIVNGRRELDRKLNIFSQVLDTRLNLKSIGFGGNVDSNMLGLTGEVNSVTEYEVLNDELTEIANNNVVDEVFLSGVTRDSLGKVGLGITVVLGVQDVAEER